MRLDRKRVAVFKLNSSGSRSGKEREAEGEGKRRRRGAIEAVDRWLHPVGNLVSYGDSLLLPRPSKKREEEVRHQKRRKRVNERKEGEKSRKKGKLTTCGPEPR